MRITTILICSLCVQCWSVGIIDAGSTGTRLNLYNINSKGIVVNTKSIKESCIMHKLSPKKAAQCVTFILGKWDVNSNLPIAFYGTAGMRSLSSLEQHAHLASIRGALHNYNLIEALVIPGEWEGLFVLHAFEYILPAIRHAYLIDLGGMSMQTIRKQESNITISSYDLGMLKSGCLQKERNHILKMALSAGVANSRQPHVIGNCVEKLFVENNLKFIRGPEAIPQVFLFSYIYDYLVPFKKVYNLSEIDELLKEQCKLRRDPQCDGIYYIAALLRRLGFKNTDEMQLIQKVNGIDVTWSLGRALEIYKTRCGEQEKIQMVS